MSIVAIIIVTFSYNVQQTSRNIGNEKEAEEQYYSKTKDFQGHN